MPMSSFKMRYGSFFAMLVFLIMPAACAPEKPAEPTALKAIPIVETPPEKTIAPKQNPSIAIASPKDNELVKSSKVTVELKVENFEIVPVGVPVKVGEGHFHVWLDSDKRVTTDSLVAFENIVSGKHTIVA